MFLGERERGSVKPEVPCSSHKLLEMWGRIGQLIEEIDLKLLQESEGDPREKHFQVSAGTSEPEPAEVRKSDVHRRDWRTQQLPLNVTAGKMRAKRNPKHL